MALYATKEFARFARKSDLPAAKLARAAREVMAGRFDVDLGGGVYKQWIARDGGGKSGGWRVIILFRTRERCFFAYGFAKNDRANVSEVEVRALKKTRCDVFRIFG